jgi:hypothetical protein
MSMASDAVGTTTDKTRQSAGRKDRDAGIMMRASAAVTGMRRLRRVDSIARGRIHLSGVFPKYRPQSRQCRAGLDRSASFMMRMPAPQDNCRRD